MKTIHRSKLTGNFTTVPNETSRDKTLSASARGILLFVFSHTDTWVISQKFLVDQFPEGPCAIRTTMLELEKAGYAVYSKDRCYQGKFANQVWKFYDRPVHPSKRSNPSDRNGNKGPKSKGISPKKVVSPTCEIPNPVDSVPQQEHVTEAETKGTEEKTSFSIPLKSASKSRAEIREEKITPADPVPPPKSNAEFWEYASGPEFRMLRLFKPWIFYYLDGRYWRTDDGDPIYDWRRYVLGLNRKIKEAKRHSTYPGPMFNYEENQAQREFNPVPG